MISLESLSQKKNQLMNDKTLTAIQNSPDFKELKDFKRLMTKLQHYRSIVWMLI